MREQLSLDFPAIEKQKNFPAIEKYSVYEGNQPGIYATSIVQCVNLNSPVLYRYYI